MTGHGGIRRVPGRWIALKGRTLGTRQILSFRVSQDCDLRRPVVDSVADETARIWDAATGQLRATLTGHTEEVKAVAIAPDGAWLATTSAKPLTRPNSTRTECLSSAPCALSAARLPGRRLFPLGTWRGQSGKRLRRSRNVRIRRAGSVLVPER